MKAKNLTITILLLVLFSAAFGQRPHGRENDKRRDAIRTLRVGIYTEVLNLTSTEAEKFWPLFNEFSDKMESNKREETKKKRELMRQFNELSDEEIEDALGKLFSYEQKALDLKKEYAEKFKKVIPVRKVVLMQKAEREFKKALLDKFREHNPPPERDNF